MNWIVNCSASDIKAGHHFEPGINCMLIQIMDPAGWFPKPKYSFKEVLQFEFLDADNLNDITSEALIQPEQAKVIAQALKRAKNDCMNVIVHCHAGFFRSGAIVEAAIEVLGFKDTGVFRARNELVYRLVKAELLKDNDGCV